MSFTCASYEVQRRSLHAGTVPETISACRHRSTGDLCMQAPFPHVELPEGWRSGLSQVTALLSTLQQQAAGAAAVSAVVRAHVHSTLTALGQNWLSTRILQPSERYMRRVPLRLLHYVLPSLVRSPHDHKTPIHNSALTALGQNWLSTRILQPAQRPALPRACPSFNERT